MLRCTDTRPRHAQLVLHYSGADAERVLEIDRCAALSNLSLHDLPSVLLRKCLEFREYF